MEALSCSRCGKPRDRDDNFCRRCGHQLTVTLPAVRPASSLPARSSAIPASLVGSVAVLALGSGLEWVARRLAGNAARAAGRALVGGDKRAVTRAQPQTPSTLSVDEVVYIRKVELRR